MSKLSIHQAFDLAIQHQRAGRYREAEQIYRQIIAQQPGHAGAKHRLGWLAWRGGRSDIAVTLIRQSIAIKSDDAVAHNDLGAALAACGQFDAAVSAYQSAIALKPDYPEAMNNLGIALGRQGKLDEAISAYREAIRLSPEDAWSYSNLGNALLRRRMFDEAIEAHRQAIALNPNFPEALLNLGSALKEKGSLEEAITVYRRAATLMPKSVPLYVSLGGALIDRGDLDEAIVLLQHAILIDPKFAHAHHMLGNAFKRKGQLDEAMAAYHRTLLIDPELAGAHRSLANVMLLRGDFIRGWEEHEWRWRRSYFPASKRSVPQHVWDGQPLAGRTILLHEEQGLGDALHFVRYIPLVMQRGGKIILECPSALVGLLKKNFSAGPNACTVIANGEAAPVFDVHCPLQALPRRFATTAETIPHDVPYLHADEAEIQFWNDRLAGDGPGLKVGLCWWANPSHDELNIRSMPMSALAPLGLVAGVSFISLQQGVATSQISEAPAEMKLVDWTSELSNFRDAALIANLDLVITIDTATAHLAGALGKPVWVMLPFNPDWRWQLGRDDSPWYPTMRLFRQPTPGDWETVGQRVADALWKRASGN